MSGLDVAAGIIGITGVGLSIAKDLFTIANGIGSAGEEVRLCAADTDAFCRMLRELGTLLQDSTTSATSGHNIAEDLLDVCERVVNPFQDLISRLRPLLTRYRESQDQFRQISLRVQWHFRHKSRVTMYQITLSQLKATLACLLSTMTLQEARRKSPQNIL